MALVVDLGDNPGELDHCQSDRQRTKMRIKLYLVYKNNNGNESKPAIAGLLNCN